MDGCLGFRANGKKVGVGTRSVRADWAALAFTAGAAGLVRSLLLLQHSAQELGQHLGRFVVRLAQVVVERIVVLALSGIRFRRDAALLERLDQSLLLSLGFGMVGNVQGRLDPFTLTP
jgi:hypothetical protein